jgi:type IV secretory pathway VirB2 component (pilin)
MFKGLQTTLISYLLLTSIAFFCIFSKTSLASDTSVACDINAACPTGYVCIGDVTNVDGSSNGSGHCEQNSITAVLCKMTGYITSKIAKTFMIFALVMVGIAFFLGKISWGMIMTVILGTALMFGAETIISLMLNDSKDGNYCNGKFSSTQTCLAVNYSDAGEKKANQTYVLNTEEITNSGFDKCKEKLGCTIYNCNFNVSLDSSTSKCKVQSGSIQVWAPDSSTADAIYAALSTSVKCDKTGVSLPSGSKCEKPSELASPRDYFLCNSSCTDTTKIAIETLSSYDYADCKDVMNKMGILE